MSTTMACKKNSVVFLRFTHFINLLRLFHYILISLKPGEQFFWFIITIKLITVK